MDSLPESLRRRMAGSLPPTRPDGRGEARALLDAAEAALPAMERARDQAGAEFRELAALDGKHCVQAREAQARYLAAIDQLLAVNQFIVSVSRILYQSEET